MSRTLAVVIRKREPPQLPSLPYTLFAYRQELRQRSTEFLRISSIKLHLTDNLIMETLRNLRQCDTIEIMNINREMAFKRQLFDEMNKVRKLERLGLHVDPRELNVQKWY